MREVFTIAGDPDILLRIRVTDLEHLKEVVNGLHRSNIITATKTLMVLDRWAPSEDLPFGPRRSRTRNASTGASTVGSAQEGSAICGADTRAR